MAHAPRARRDDETPGRADGLTIAPAPGGRKTLLLLAGAGAIAAITLLSLFGPRREAPPAPPAPAQRAERPAPAVAPPPAPAPAAAAPAPEPPTPSGDTAPAQPPPDIAQ